MHTKCWYGNPTENGGLGERRDKIWNQSIKLDIKIWIWKETLWVNNPIVCTHYVGITQILWQHKKKTGKQGICTGTSWRKTKQQKNRNIYEYGKVCKMEKGLAYKYDNPPWQKYQKMVTVMIMRNDCRSQGKVMGLNSTPSKTVHLNRKPTAA